MFTKRTRWRALERQKTLVYKEPLERQCHPTVRHNTSAVCAARINEFRDEHDVPSLTPEETCTIPRFDQDIARKQL